MYVYTVCAGTWRDVTWPDNWTAATGVSIIILLQKELFLNKITAVILGA